MKAIVPILVCLCLVLLNSCEKEQGIRLEGADYLIFGHFYGECDGEGCIEIFKLEPDKLLEDKRDKYPVWTEFYEGDYTQLSQQKFENAKDIINYFPDDLLKERNPVIGQPDAGDWGGLYVEYNYDGIRKFWLIDQVKEHVPVKYHPFIIKINEKIRQIQ
ncbi:hypothetical protein GCM10028807_36070 [Spirosoma daeguense]